jgi:hypothetical protein
MSFYRRRQTGERISSWSGHTAARHWDDSSWAACQSAWPRRPIVPFRVSRDVKESGDASIRILLGVDGSPGADAAMHALAARTWPSGTELRI